MALLTSPKPQSLQSAIRAKARLRDKQIAGGAAPTYQDTVRRTAAANRAQSSPGGLLAPRANPLQKAWNAANPDRAMAYAKANNINAQRMQMRDDQWRNEQLREDQQRWSSQVPPPETHSGQRWASQVPPSEMHSGAMPGFSPNAAPITAAPAPQLTPEQQAQIARVQQAQLALTRNTTRGF